MPALPWPWHSAPPSTHTDDIHDAPTTTNATPASLQHDARLRSILVVLSSVGIGVALTTASMAIANRYGRRIRNSDWVTPDMFRRRRWVRGVVTSVGDADNFRLYHTPPLGYRWPFKYRRIPSINKGTHELKDETIHIRIAGIDAPEGPHFGRPGQPYFTESFAWLRGKIQGKNVYCQLLRRDQYSRIVANVHLAPRVLPRPLSSGRVLALEMLRAGWGTTYEQTGAEYGNAGKTEFLRVEAEAKAARRGMWAKGAKAETPAQYKRRHAAASSPAEAEALRTKSTSAKSQAQSQSQAGRNKMGWFRRLLGW